MQRNRLSLLYWLLVAGLCLSMYSCSDDEPDPQEEIEVVDYAPYTAENFWIYQIITDEIDTSSKFMYMTPNDSMILGKSYRIMQENGTNNRFFQRVEDGHYYEVLETLDMTEHYESNFLRTEVQVGDSWEEVLGDAGHTRLLHEVLAVDEERFVGSEYFREMIRIKTTYEARQEDGSFVQVYESERSYSKGIGLVESIDIAFVAGVEIRAVQTIEEYAIVD